MPIAEFCARAGVPEEQVRTVTRRIASARSVSTLEELGIEQIPHSTLNSYLHKLLWILVGSFAKPGGMAVHSTLLDLERVFKGPDSPEVTPVTGQPGRVPAWSPAT